MPTCKICEKEFPNRCKIGGIEKNISNRKYCLICSPFGEHNTRRLHINSPVELGKKTCPRCSTEKSSSEFYKRRNGKDFSPYCTRCSLDEVRERQNLFKKQCVTYKGGKCELCDYSKCFAALDFHHKDPKQKKFGIANAKLTSFNERVKRELDKCILLCANCHRETHYNLSRRSSIG